MVNADISIKATVSSVLRLDSEPFRPTRTWSETFIEATNTADYRTASETLGNKVFDYVESERQRGCRTDLHLSITLSNATHAPVARGVVPLAKGHRDAAVTDIGLTDADVVTDSVNNIVADLTTQAKYA